jgi:hypothetical protein
MTSRTTAALEWAPHASAADQYTQQWLSGNRGKKYTHAGNILGCRQRVQQDMQGQQHQTKANRHPAQVAGPRVTAEVECQQTCYQQDRPDGRNVE